MPPPTFTFNTGESHLASFGEHAAFDGGGALVSKAVFGRRYRTKPKQMGHGGSGHDEHLRTSSAHKLAKKGPAAKRKRMIHAMSSRRSRTSDLVYVHGAGLAGHPGALRRAGKKNSFVVSGHGRRDRARARAVESEYASAYTVHNDEVVAAQEATIRGSVETARTFCDPYEALPATPPHGLVHPQFGDVSNQHNYDALRAHVGNTREDLKWSAARDLIHHGLGAEVPLDMSNLLVANNGDPAAARASWDAGGHAPNTTPHSIAAQLDPAKPVRGRTIIPNANGSGRAISPPRQRR